MDKSVLLIAELNHANLHQREMFHSALQAQSWSNHPRIASAWTRTFQSIMKVAEAVRTRKSDVAQAAGKGPAPSFKVLTRSAETEPVEYEVRPQAVL